jgi:photosystem II stability/assembly factor-like uncharacterized protein
MKYKPILFIFTISILLISCLTLKTTGWQPVIDKQPLEKIITYYQAAFTGRDYGIVTGFAGFLHYTTDRALTWKQAANSSFDLFAVEVIGDYVWACGENGNVRLSKDLGKHFEPVTDFGKPVPDHCRYLSFVSRKVGWIASPEILGLTLDGGITWSELSLPQGCGQIMAIDLFTEQKGVILDSQATLYFTSDQGLSWRRQETFLKSVPLDLTVYKSPGIAMRFKDAGQGMIVAKVKNPFACIALISENGGSTWQQQILSRDADYSSSSVYISRDMTTITILCLKNQTVSVFTR